MRKEAGCPRCQAEWTSLGPEGGDCPQDGFVPRAEIEAEAPRADEDGVGTPGTGADVGRRSQSQAERLLTLVYGSQAVLFSDQFGEPHVAIHGARRGILRLASKTARWWLSKLFYDSEGRPPSPEAVRTALELLKAEARFDGPMHILQVRVAEYGGAYWYDLADGRAVRTTDAGWEIVERPPIIFRRLPHQKSQVAPKRGGRLDDILRFVNLRSDADRLLFKVTLVSDYIPGIPHPIVAQFGPQGSGKSTLFRVMKELLDPSALSTLTAPDNIREFVQLVSHHWFVPLDNLSHIPNWLSDALCRACSGDGFSKRELYTDDDDVIYSFQHALGVNGINLVIQKPDLLDRSLPFELAAIPMSDRREEKSFWEEFQNAKPQLLGAIFDALAGAMGEYANVQVPHLPRMADFARWCCSVCRALGYNDRSFLDAYASKVAFQHEEAIAASTVAQALVQHMAGRTYWQGSPSLLLAELNEEADRLRISTRSKSWPKNPSWLSRRLRESAANLIATGIAIDFGKDKDRSITLRAQESAVDGVGGVGDVANAILNAAPGSSPNVEAAGYVSTASTASAAKSLPPPDDGRRKYALSLWEIGGRLAVYLRPGETIVDLESWLPHHSDDEVLAVVGLLERSDE